MHFFYSHFFAYSFYFFVFSFLQVEISVLYINPFSFDIDSYLWEEWKERHKDACEDLSALFSNLRFLPLAVLSANILMIFKE
jgi:hypothetical protein